MSRAVVHLADCLDVLRAMPAESIDAVVCGPAEGEAGGARGAAPVRAGGEVTAPARIQPLGEWRA